MRHTCASLLFQRGLNAKQVQRWLGHHSASFTLDTYVHLLEDELPDAAFFDAITATTTAEGGNEGGNERERDDARRLPARRGG